MNKLLVGLSLAGLFALPGLSQAYVFKSSISYTFVSTSQNPKVTVAPGATSANQTQKPNTGTFGAIQGKSTSVCVFSPGSNVNWTNTTVPIVMTSNNVGISQSCGTTVPTVCCYIASGTSGF
jgi:hypothetical protein